MQVATRGRNAWFVYGVTWRNDCVFVCVYVFVCSVWYTSVS